MSQSKRWVLTLNNYTPEEYIASTAVECSYSIIGKEVGESGTPHLQGFYIFKTNKRLPALKKIFARAHWEPAKGSSLEASKYCKKEGDFTETGSFPQHSGKRNDLEEFKQAVKDGVIDKKRLREEFSEVMAKYPRFVTEYIRDQIPVPEVECFPLCTWQQQLYDKLKLQPHPTQIIFLVDKIGNTGKTWFAKYYCSLHSNAQLIEPAKKADMAYALQDDLRVLFVNVTRQQQEHFQYSFFESLKDGRVFSPKYESVVRTFGKVHVVVMMNQDPDMNLLSKHRYDTEIKPVKQFETE